MEHPILTVREDKLVNPFASSLKEQDDINIKGNILPILGDNQMNNYLDISIPSITTIDLLDNTMSIGNCKDNNISIPQKNLNENA